MWTGLWPWLRGGFGRGRWRLLLFGRAIGLFDGRGWGVFVLLLLLLLLLLRRGGDFGFWRGGLVGCK